MLPCFTETYGNPASGIHRMGHEAGSAVDQARSQVARLIGASPKEIVFTSGATESNNLAIQGVALAARGDRRRIVTTAIEHKSVLGVCHELSRHGYEVTVRPVDQAGLVALEAVDSAVDERTLLLSVQAANNEIGTIQRVAELVELAQARGVLVHCDAAQAVGKIPVDVDGWGVDLLSISAHKLYGPKGVGALYIRGGPYALPMAPLLIGGGQEWGLRSGTSNVPGIVGLGAACALCQEVMVAEATRVAALRDRLEASLLSALPGLVRNGAIDRRLPNNSNLTLPGVDAEALIANMHGIALSTGAACTSGAPDPSHVLLAIGLSREAAQSTIRVGLGRFNTMADVDICVEAVVHTNQRLLQLMQGKVGQQLP
jgi:cysteine desulfurase